MRKPPRDEGDSLELIGIAVEGKIVHQGDLVGPTGVSKLVAPEGIQVVDHSVAEVGDVIGIATGEDYSKVRATIDRKKS